jgi:hypothetical protein
MGCHSYDSEPTQGVMRMILVSSLLVNIMSCYLFYIRDTLFNVGDPPIETDFMSVWMPGPLSHRMSECYLKELIINLLHRWRIITLIQSSSIECTM